MIFILRIDVLKQSRNGLLNATGISIYPKQQLRLKGYGNYAILQGSFLFVFNLVMYGLNLVMYGLQRSHRTDFLHQFSLAPKENAWGLALSFQF